MVQRIHMLDWVFGLPQQAHSNQNQQKQHWAPETIEHSKSLVLGNSTSRHHVGPWFSSQSSLHVKMCVVLVTCHVLSMLAMFIYVEPCHIHNMFAMTVNEKLYKTRISQLRFHRFHLSRLADPEGRFAPWWIENFPEGNSPFFQTNHLRYVQLHKKSEANLVILKQQKLAKSLLHLHMLAYAICPHCGLKPENGADYQSAPVRHLVCPFPTCNPSEGGRKSIYEACKILRYCWWKTSFISW